MTCIVGIDPGGKESGLVLLELPRCDVLRACVVTRDATGKLPDGQYITEVMETVAEYCAQGVEGGHEVLVAVEGLVHPNPHMGLANVMGLIGAGMVLGAVIRDYPDAGIIRPNKNGSRSLDTYPAKLQPKRGSGKGMDRLRHARSAYDVAVTAVRLMPS